MPDPVALDDDALMAGLRAGRREAFSGVYAKYHASIYNLCARLVRDREEAKDLTQDVFVKAFRHLPEHDGEMSLRPWLYRVATNVCRDHVRRRTKEASAVEAGGGLIELAARPDSFEQSQTAALVEEALGQLNERYRAALVLKDLHGFASDELAEVLEVPRASVDLVVHRARAAFRRSFAAVSEKSGVVGCGFARQVALNAVGRAISRQERREIARHVRTCPECRRSLKLAGVGVTGLAAVLAPLPVPTALQAPPPWLSTPGPHLAPAPLSPTAAATPTVAPSATVPPSATVLSPTAAASSGVAPSPTATATTLSAGGPAAVSPLLLSPAATATGSAAAGGGTAILAKVGASLASKVVVVAALAALAVGGAAVGWRADRRPASAAPAASAARSVARGGLLRSVRGAGMIDLADAHSARFSAPGMVASAFQGAFQGGSPSSEMRQSTTFARWAGHGSPTGVADQRWGENSPWTWEHNAVALKLWREAVTVAPPRQEGSAQTSATTGDQSAVSLSPDSGSAGARTAPSSDASAGTGDALLTGTTGHGSHAVGMRLSGGSAGGGM